jgi:hypothetical protein
MAISADGFIADAEHRITCFEYLVIGVADGASWNSHLGKDFPMLALVEKIGVNGVALPADVPHP